MSVKRGESRAVMGWQFKEEQGFPLVQLTPTSIPTSSRPHSFPPFLLLSPSFPPAPGVVRPDWNGFNMIHESASRVAALDIGFQPSVAARSAPPAKFVYLLGADDYADGEVPDKAFVVYQGE